MSLEAPITAYPLPTPADRPAADVVVYDGRCSFCLRQARRLARLDGGARLAFLSLHDPSRERLFPQLDRVRLEEEMVVVDRAGGVHGGADAVRYLSRRLPSLWLAAPLLHLPGTARFWRWAYRQIARRRGRWSAPACEDGSCLRSRPTERERPA